MNDEQASEQSPLPDQDVILSILARLAQEAEATMTITLSTHGAVVCGLLVGRDKWFALLTEQLRQAGDTSEFGPLLQESVASAAANQGEDLRYGYVHLQDARVFAGQGLMPESGDGFLWRGRISEVSGWALGSIPLR